MGTPFFAVGILDKLIREGVDVVGVVTSVDKKAGRGLKLRESDVKKYAKEKELNILQPENLKEESFLNDLKKLNADLFIVVAFRMLPEAVWKMPPKGTVNLHASLLPDYRGAAPINWVLINGEYKTGVTTFFIEKEIDTGNIIERKEVEIGENEIAGELHDRLMQAGADLMYSTYLKIEKDDIQPISQEELIKDKRELKKAPKIFKKDCKINFSKPVEQVHNFCRGLSPYPGAWCSLYHKGKDKELIYKILKTEKTSIPILDGKQIDVDDKGLLFPTADFYLRVLDIQPEGKRKMSFKEFIAGNQVSALKLR